MFNVKINKSINNDSAALFCFHYIYGQAIYVDWYDWPQFECPNIYNFLIETPSVYTGESLKSYKSQDAYNFYDNGWVENINVFPIPPSPSIYFAIGHVNHSQKVSAISAIVDWLTPNLYARSWSPRLRSSFIKTIHNTLLKAWKGSIAAALYSRRYKAEDCH